MNLNTQFSVAVHILCLVASHPGEMTSISIASSVNTNPVVIRRINALLKSAGLVEINAGKGNIILAKAADVITLLDVFHAVRKKEPIFNVHKDTNLKCNVGGNIQEALSAPLKKAEKALEDSLSKTTIEDMQKRLATL